MRRGYIAGALAALTVAGVGALALPAGTADWAPVTYGLSASPDEMLPAVISPARPARVVSTTLDLDGRPVVTVQEATDRDDAAGLVRTAQQARNAVGVEVDAVVEAAGSDPQRSAQWDLDTMRVPEAWQRSTGAGVTVAVVDSGVDDTHPDLIGQVLPGYNAITDAPGGTTDENGHGTHVAGTIAALTGNGTGVASVAPDARILPVKVLGADNRGWTSDFAEGVVWAADHGAQVINMSLGSTTQTGAVSTAIDYARSRNVVVVASAGNSRAQGSPTNYPAADAGVIGVAATDSADIVASYSNAGNYVDVAAPGSGILSTVPQGGYAYYNGTSMAAPHVSAVAALLVASRPGITPDQVESALTSSAVDRGAPGKDVDYGYGRVDAAGALEAVAPTSPPVTSVPESSAPTTAPPASSAPTTAPPVTSAPEPTVTTEPTTQPTTEPPTAEPTSPTPTSSPTPKPTPTPTPTPAPTRPVVTANVSTKQVGYGMTTRTVFTVAAGGTAWAAQPVSVCYSAVGGRWTCTPATTTTAGTYTYTRKATGAFRVRLAAAATSTNTAASDIAIYTVKATVAVARAGKGTLTVRVTGATGQKVTVQRYTGGKWKTAKTYAAVTSRKVTGLAAGGRYRVVVAGTAAVQGVTSGTVRA
ncbi:S8 family peptidase [Actinoplanes sp. NBC_00393]|uniref:S8 family peptidase n=1 Tax=Actinoplanes sp. NBC_00393 TaxID=2975953 RepID=UPI002E238EC4